MISLVLGPQIFHDGFNLFGFDDCQKGMVHRRPGMVSEVGLAVFISTAKDVVPTGKPPLTVVLKHFHDFIIVCLVECYEYRFHCFPFFVELLFGCLESCGLCLLPLFLTGGEDAVYGRDEDEGHKRRD